MSPTLDREIGGLLISTKHELESLQKRLASQTERVTDQFVADTVQNLERRKRALKNRLLKMLTQNPQYHMPEGQRSEVLRLIHVLSHEGGSKAKLEADSTNQETLWIMLDEIQEALVHPEHIKPEVARPRLHVDVEPPHEEYFDLSND